MIDQSPPPDLYLIRIGRLQAGVRIHWIVFLSINFILFLINLLTDYWYPWHLWPLFGWGIGLLIHTGVINIVIRYEFPQDRAIRIHGLIYLILLGLFLLMGIIFFDDILDFLWIFILGIIFILAWLNHYIAYHFSKPGRNITEAGSMPMSGFVQRRMNYASGMHSISIEEANSRASRAIGNQIGFSYHIVNYIAICILLVTINLFTNSYDFWAIWPIASWGLAIMIHYHSAKIVINRALFHPVRKFYWLWFPSTLCIYLLIVDIASDGTLDWFLYPSIPIMVVSLMIGGIVIITKSSKMREQDFRANYNPPPIVNPPSKGIPNQNPAVEIKPIRKMYCPNCGTEFTSGTRFCPLCGNELPRD